MPPRWHTCAFPEITIPSCDAKVTSPTCWFACCSNQLVWPSVASVTTRHQQTSCPSGLGRTHDQSTRGFRLPCRSTFLSSQGLGKSPEVPCVSQLYEFDADRILLNRLVPSSVTFPDLLKALPSSHCPARQQRHRGWSAAVYWRKSQSRELRCGLIRSAWVTGMSFGREDSLWRLSGHMRAWHLEEVGDLMEDYLRDLDWP